MNYLLYFAGFFLVCLPGAFVLRRKCRFETLAHVGGRRHLWLSWVHGMNFIDLMRALCGVLALRFSIEAILQGNGDWTVELGALGVVCLLGFVTQMFFYKCDHDELVMPVGYLAGMMMAFVPPHLALMIIVMGTATAIATRAVCSGLLVAAMSSVGLGLVFAEQMHALVILGGMLGIAALLPLIMNRQMTIMLSAHPVVRRVVLRHDSPGVSR